MGSILTREKRDDALIATFVDGFAVGWKMAVIEAFRDALDIKLTPRKVGGHTKMIWTQGKLYDFHEGDTFYDSSTGCGDWHEGTLAVQVLSATSSSYVAPENTEVIAENPSVLEQAKVVPGEGANEKRIQRRQLIQGMVRFRVYRPDSKRAALEERQVLECTQDSFVTFLRTGYVRTTDGVLVNLFDESSSM